MKPAKNFHSAEEWLRQAAYDMKTAEAMFSGKRYIYAIFMCHLSIEKALKAMYALTFKDAPPKTHNLIYLAEKIELEVPDTMYDFIFTLNGLSVPTRYPDDLRKLLRYYSKAKTRDVLKQSKGVLKWLRKMSSVP